MARIGRWGQGLCHEYQVQCDLGGTGFDTNLRTGFRGKTRGLRLQSFHSGCYKMVSFAEQNMENRVSNPVAPRSHLCTIIDSSQGRRVRISRAGLQGRGVIAFRRCVARA